jgi:hypothetical protein
MCVAYVLINCDLDHKYGVRKGLSKLPGILEAAELDAAYTNKVKNWVQLKS